jgi:hypothetical protein
MTPWPRSPLHCCPSRQRTASAWPRCYPGKPKGRTANERTGIVESEHQRTDVWLDEDDHMRIAVSPAEIETIVVAAAITDHFDVSFDDLARLCREHEKK